MLFLLVKQKTLSVLKKVLLAMGLGLIFTSCSTFNKKSRTTKPIEIHHKHHLENRVFSQEELDAFPKVIPVGRPMVKIIGERSGAPVFSRSHVTYIFKTSDGIWKFGGTAHRAFFKDEIADIVKQGNHIATSYWGEVIGSHKNQTLLLTALLINPIGRPKGHLVKDTDVGVFGKLHRLDRQFATGPALRTGQAMRGPAILKATVNGSEPRLFDIYVEEANIQYLYKEFFRATITDPAFKEKFNKHGGLFGMSGSPVKQINPETGEKKFIGAVSRGNSEQILAISATHMLAVHLGK